MPRVFHELLIGLEAEHERELKELRTSFIAELQKLYAQGNVGDPAAILCKDVEDSFLPATRTSRRSSKLSDGSELGSPGFDLLSSLRRAHTDAIVTGSEKSEMCDRSEPSFRSSVTAEAVHFHSGEILGQQIQKRLNNSMNKRNNIMNSFLTRKRPRNSVDHSRMIVKVVHSTLFDSVCAVMIMLNASFLGIATHFDEATADASVSSRKVPIAFEVADNIFSAWFFAEIILRIHAEGIIGFCCLSPNRRWNMFDSLVVGSDIAEIFVRISQSGDESQLGSLTVMRLLRVLRVTRALRVLRLVNFFAELRLMVKSLMSSGMALFWSMVLLFMIIYIFGIFLMQAVALHLHNEADLEKRGSLLRWFGTLPRVSFTLFLCVTNGVSWHLISDLLTHVHWTNTLVLSFFIFFTIFAMLNIITGIFVETALSAVQNDKDEVIREEKHSENSIMNKLEQIFREADKEDSGGITLEDFEGIMALEETRILMKTMGLEINEAKGMFNLMDTDRSGQVSIQEFLVGCMRMKGGAKAVDLITLMYENKKLLDMWGNYAAYVEDQFKITRKFEYRLEKVLASIRNGVKSPPIPRRPQSLSDDRLPKETNTESTEAKEIILL